MSLETRQREKVDHRDVPLPPPVVLFAFGLDLDAMAGGLGEEEETKRGWWIDGRE